MEYLDKILVLLRDSKSLNLDEISKDIPFPIKNQNISEKFSSQYMFFMILVFFALFLPYFLSLVTLRKSWTISVYSYLFVK